MCLLYVDVYVREKKTMNNGYIIQFLPDSLEMHYFIEVGAEL